jgi:hypothetical protein
MINCQKVRKPSEKRLLGCPCGEGERIILKWWEGWTELMWQRIRTDGRLF